LDDEVEVLPPPPPLEEDALALPPPPAVIDETGLPVLAPSDVGLPALPPEPDASLDSAALLAPPPLPPVDTAALFAPVPVEDELGPPPPPDDALLPAPVEEVPEPPPLQLPPRAEPAATAALVAPIEDAAEVDEVEPAEVLPQAPRHRVAPVTRTAPPTRRLQPGDLVCPECGEGNLPVRKFCSRCGTSLHLARVVAVPWWKKVFRRGPKVMKAGARPKTPGQRGSRKVLRQMERKIRLTLAVLGTLAALLYGAYPPFRTDVNDKVLSIKHKFFGLAEKTLSPIHQSSVTASAQVRHHPGALAVDEFKNTYWAAPYSITHQPSLTLRFSKTVILKEAIITSGASDDFLKYDRPEILHFVYSNQESDTFNISDTSKQQKIVLGHGVGVKSVQIQVIGVYEAQNSNDVAITEIELFGLG
jgi:hypothetical protein